MDALSGPQNYGAVSFPDIEFSEAWVRRFDVPGPRYTSYPTADRFRGEFTEQAYIDCLARRARNSVNPPLSVYVHLPFCESLCYFCACNKIITQDHGRSASYLQYLDIEMDRTCAHLGADRKTVQLHLGGGTPTFLSGSELTSLMSSLRRHFEFTPDAELSIEIDPRTVDDATLSMLAGLGFNRSSFGVQDFDPQVQAAVNRVQPLEAVERALRASRDCGFESVNVDLIYGLPRQTLASFSRTLDALERLSPDRIALYNYAHLPERFKAQRLIRGQDLPSAETRLQIFLMALRRLLQAGYVYIGLDHFAKPDDELNRARLDGSLQRNFQGYTTRAECDLLGFGVSAIGKVGAAYSQSAHSVKAYCRMLDEGRLPIARGLELSRDDVLRREVIMKLMCSMPVDFNELDERYGVQCESYFAPELEKLATFFEAGLLGREGRGLVVRPKGRLFVRAACVVFDRFLATSTVFGHSRLI